VWDLELGGLVFIMKEVTGRKLGALVVAAHARRCGLASCGKEPFAANFHFSVLFRLSFPIEIIGKDL
jgi:hypothetical protein